MALIVYICISVFLLLQKIDPKWENTISQEKSLITLLKPYFYKLSSTPQTHIIQVFLHCLG